MVATIDVSKDGNYVENPPHSENKPRGYTNPVFADDLRTPRVDNINEKEPKSSLNNHGNKSEVSLANYGSYSETKEYEPYDYCTSEKPTTYCDTFVHYLKAAVGTGILAIPAAYKDAGYSVGVLGVIFIAFMYTYCVHLLIDAEYELCKRKRVPNMSYANTVHAAFEECLPKQRWLASTGKFFANFFFMVYESGGCAIYIVFISQNLQQLLEYYLEHEVSERLIMFWVTLPLILVCWIRDLKLLAPLSAVANFITIVCFGVVFYYVFREIPTFEGKKSVGSVTKVPAYLNTALFAIACTGIILPLKSEMKKSRQFGSCTGVLNIAMIPISILYAIFGFFSYLKYGDELKGSITLNLPKEEMLAQSIKGLYSLSVFISYHLCYYVVLDIVWKNFLKDKIQNNNIFWEYVVRTAIPIITFIMAYAIPKLEIFISLVGALGISTTSLVIPIIVNTLVFWRSHETKFEFYIFFAKNATLFCISIIIFFTGITLSIHDVIELYRK